MARRRSKMLSDINVVPYIDVMLVLLVIFMIASPVLTQGVKIDLPKINAPPVAPQELEDPLIVTVDAQGAYFVNLGDEDEGRQLKRDALVDYVQKILKNRGDIPVFVRGDTLAAYGEVLDLLALIQSAGAGYVNLLTLPPEPTDT